MLDVIFKIEIILSAKVTDGYFMLNFRKFYYKLSK